MKDHRVGPTDEALSPARAGLDALVAARQHYRGIVADGGWPRIPDGPTLVAGEAAAADRLEALIDRLEAEGDLVAYTPSTPVTSLYPNANPADPAASAATADAPRPVYDALLSEAVRRFQERNGLEVDGKVGPDTLAALNVPARERLQQIDVNLERWTEVPDELPARRIEVNLAAQELTTFDGGRPVGRMKVVVGKPSSPTPTFRDRVTHVVLRPYWNVPSSITSRELAPKARKDPGYLAARGYEVEAGGRWVSPTAVDWSSGSHRIRQRPGSGNSLGLVKFVLAGQTLIYLHDTPEDRAFSRPVRALSHGCVRLERPLDLAEWVLDGEDGWSPERIRSAASSGGERWVDLDREVPVYVRYFTAWAGDDGRVQFRDDVYREDPAVMARLEMKRDREGLTAGAIDPAGEVGATSADIETASLGGVR